MDPITSRPSITDATGIPAEGIVTKKTEGLFGNRKIAPVATKYYQARKSYYRGPLRVVPSSIVGVSSSASHYGAQASRVLSEIIHIITSATQAKKRDEGVLADCYEKTAQIYKEAEKYYRQADDASKAKDSQNADYLAQVAQSYENVASGSIRVTQALARENKDDITHWSAITSIYQKAVHSRIKALSAFQQGKEQVSFFWTRAAKVCEDFALNKTIYRVPSIKGDISKENELLFNCYQTIVQYLGQAADYRDKAATVMEDGGDKVKADYYTSIAQDYEDAAQLVKQATTVKDDEFQFRALLQQAGKSIIKTEVTTNVV
ncbi:MAG: hypothetical protein A3F67_06785 [Verrucomicrobia bacterium RIFCSPHIGHO2_12_FULL_41_10]|nr:MAG: hypothetical protein A3F67_06785 [Verrucomicrobia bacterium RIFCSPHIGHO2_12_FULL_41_10]HLB33269.1 hypothetical protein [Chthoniobacterales bacterium]